ncbi:MAG: DNA polymerase III subunit delta [Saprospiraceae bacterium]|nr:DNA polymerase III subunit delta [Saprospiraceae bacterium]
MTYPQIIKELKAKKYSPIYLLHGNEPYYIDKISRYVEENVLTEGEKSFNQMIMYGKDTDHKTLIDTCSRYPMMASHQVVILKEAQEMKTLKELLPYIEKPVHTTILVICFKHKKFDGRTKFGKLVKQKALIFESKKLYDNQIPDWIQSYLKDKKLSISPSASVLVAEYLGENLSKVSNELDKLAINLAPGTEVNEKHIQEQIGISKEYNVFELQKALGAKNVVKSNRIINYFISNPKKNPLVVVVGTLFNFFSKVYLTHFLKNSSEKEMMEKLGVRHAFFLKDYKLAARNYPYQQSQDVISILKEYDLKSKGVDRVNATEGDLMKEMVFKILHA